MTPRLCGRLLLATSLAVGCADARDTTPLAPERATPVPSTAALQVPAFDHFGADVELRVTFPGLAKATRGNARLQRYHVERTRGADNVWTTRTTFDASVLASGNASSADTRLPVTMVRRDGDPTPQFFDTEGREVSLPPDLAREKARLTEFPKRGAATSAARGPDGGTPIDAIVLTPDRRDARLARIRERMGAPSGGKGPGRSTYRAQYRDLTIEAVVDDQVGAIVEETFTRSGKLIAHRRSEFAQLADGTHVMSRTVSEHPLDDTATARVVIEHAYRNVKVRRGGLVQ